MRAETAATVAEIEQDPLWQAMPAAMNGQLLELRAGAQVRLGGPLHKFVGIDAIAELVGAS